jgi:hypothetical protein
VLSLPPSVRLFGATLRGAARGVPLAIDIRPRVGTYSPDRTSRCGHKTLDWPGLDRSGGRCRLSARALPGGGRHGRHVAKDDAAREAREHVRKVVLRVHTDEVAGSDHRVRDGRALRTGVRPGEEKIATPDGRPAMETFDDPVVDRQPPILQKAGQGDAVVEQIAVAAPSSEPGGSMCW